MLLHTNNKLAGPTCTGGMSARLLIIIAITISIVIHGLLLMTQSHNTPKIIPTNFGDSIIHVSLAAPEKKLTQTKLTTNIKSANKTAPAKAPAPVKKNPQPVTIQAATPSTHENTLPDSTSSNHLNPIINAPTPTKPIRQIHHPDSNKSPPNHKNTNSLSIAQAKKNHHNYLLGQVRSLLARHFVYPLRARRRGWEGEVLVDFHINKKGQLNNVRLAHGSGYSLLDQSALLAITKIKAIPLPQNTSPPQAMDFQLPVTYQLNEG